MNGRPRIGLLVALLALALGAGIYFGTQAGELEPPGGPGPTMKPLNDLEPRRVITPDMLPLTITEKGTSWYLLGDIDTPGGGITIEASHVTIDLMGFSFEGGTGVGITTGSLPYRGTTVRNGTVTGWAQQGLLLGNDARVINVHARNNGSNGIEVETNSLVLDSIATANDFHGIVAGHGSVIRSCVANDNVQNGIWGTFNVLIVDCAVDNNYRSGIRADSDCYVVNNTLRGNSLAGGNDFAGIWVYGDRNRIEGNHASSNRNGYIIDGSDNLVVRNSENGSLTDGYRIGTGTGNIIGTVRTSIASAGPWDNFDQ